jgi:hypothetical protein
MPADEKRDVVVAAFAQYLIRDRPDEALARIRTISGPEKQREALYNAWIHLPEDRQESALRWLETANVSSDERELLLHGPNAENEH